MWIVPKNIQKSETLHFVPVVWASKREFQKSFPTLEMSVMWRSKPSSYGTWYRRWKRDSWIRLLFGRILKHSTQNHFMGRYIQLLPDIPVNPSALQEADEEPQTLDTFGRIYQNLSSQLDLFSASLKTCRITYQWDSPRFIKAYKVWVTGLRRDYSLRLRWGLLKSGKGYLSLHTPTEKNCGDVWPTPMTSMGSTQKSPNGEVRLQLPKAVKYWPTPKTRDGVIGENQNLTESLKNRNSPDLPTAVRFKEYWPTPTVAEVQKATKETHQRSLTKLALNGQLNPAKLNMNGKNRESLNPGWVAQLMGTTLEQSFFGCMGMPSSRKSPKKPSDI